jgi:hypothetical protein
MRQFSVCVALNLNPFTPTACLPWQHPVCLAMYSTHFTGSSRAVCAESGYQHGRIYGRNLPVTLGLCKTYINTAGWERRKIWRKIAFLFLSANTSTLIPIEAPKNSKFTNKQSAPKTVDNENKQHNVWKIHTAKILPEEAYKIFWLMTMCTHINIFESKYSISGSSSQLNPEHIYLTSLTQVRKNYSYQQLYIGIFAEH